MINGVQPKPTVSISEIVANTNVSITINAPSIRIVAETPRLILRPVEPGDVSFYQSLWADTTVMAKYGNGKPLLYKDAISEENGTINYAQNRLVDSENSWCNRWNTGNPFSGMVIIKKENNEKIGSIIIGGGELAGFGTAELWNKGYATEAAAALTKAVLPAIVLSQCANNIPQKVEATARDDNPGSWKVMEKLGMKLDPQVTEAEFGGVKFSRRKYEIAVSDLVEDYQKIKSSRSQGRSAKPILPLYQLKRESANPHEAMNSINKGGHTLRNRESITRKYR